MLIKFTRGTINQKPIVPNREWLVTNGIGGFASGTISGVLTRRYHGLLIAALNPPLGRTVLVSKIEESVQVDGHSFDLFTNSWDPGKFYDHGYQHLDQFHLDGTTPVWTYGLGDALLRKKIWMVQGENTTVLHYTYLRGRSPLSLMSRLFVNHRDYHATSQGRDWHMEIERQDNQLSIKPRESTDRFYIRASDGTFASAHDWYLRHYLAIEADRGLDMREDFLMAGTLATQLNPGQTLTLVCTTHSEQQPDGDALWLAQQAHEARLWAYGISELSSHDTSASENAPLRQLVLAADQFIVERATNHDKDGRSIIAGYPWFGDWGRDTMIALPGLTLATGRPEIARKILETFHHYVDRGMLPNRFPDQGERPEYNTADATLWYFEAIQAYLDSTQDLSLIETLFPTLEAIIEAHQKGTRYQIHQDPADGLLYAGEEGVQLTWMDAKVGDWVVTPRIGKPIEINALWFNALHIMADLAGKIGKDPLPYQQMIAAMQPAFQRFWHEAVGYCFDVIDGPHGHETLLRPNQLLAVSLRYSPFDASQQKKIVDSCATHLLTPHGLRSLAPFEKGYTGRYGGSVIKRDGAYHQGTTWGWLIGPFVTAHYRVYQDARMARSFLDPLLNHLWDGCLGTMSEIFDGKVPFSPRGAFAQAWTVAEVLRVWKMLKE
ncbi:MAG: amylo-alpha-1,6-glucosidase [Ardenticatenaceae bacterium]|nr:amylo-alpha-1,6-glucosidase [Ardenticatenaceae bacterium]